MQETPCSSKFYDKFPNSFLALSSIRLAYTTGQIMKN